MAASTSPRRYSVLYFKRTNKMHKFRGREDGILIVSPPPSCACKLVSANDDDDVDVDVDDDEGDDDDEEEGPRRGGVGTTKKRAYAAFKKRGSKASSATKKSAANPVWSGVDPVLSRRAHSLLAPADNDTTGAKTTIDADDTLVLSGQWECVIVCSMEDENDEKTTRARPPPPPRAPLGALQRRVGPGLAGAGSAPLVARRTLGGPKTAAGPSKGGAHPPPPPFAASRAGKNAIPLPPMPGATTGVVARGSGAFAAPGARRTLGGSAASAPSSSSSSSLGGALAVASDDGDDEDADSKKVEALERERARRAGMMDKFRKKDAPSGRSASSMMPSVRPPSKGGGARGDVGGVMKGSGSGDDFPGAKGERINLPSYVRGALRPHQREGIAFLWNCVTGVNEGIACAYANVVATSSRGCDSSDESEVDDGDGEGDDDDDVVGASRKKACVVSKSDVVPRGAVLADEMGLGKTLMTISTIYAYHRLHRDRRFIVVCPSTLVSNWSSEFDKWLGKASQPKRIVVRNGVESEGLRSLKSFVPLKQNQSEVLILSYEIFRLHVNVIKEANKVGILVVDEGHRLKNTSGSQILTALNSVSVESRILISGTPIQVSILAHPPTPVSLESTQ